LKFTCLLVGYSTDDPIQQLPLFLYPFGFGSHSNGCKIAQIQNKFVCLTRLIRSCASLGGEWFAIYQTIGWAIRFAHAITSQLAAHDLPISLSAGHIAYTPGVRCVYAVYHDSGLSPEAHHQKVVCLTSITDEKRNIINLISALHLANA